MLNFSQPFTTFSTVLWLLCVLATNTSVDKSPLGETLYDLRDRVTIHVQADISPVVGWEGAWRLETLKK